MSANRMPTNAKSTSYGFRLFITGATAKSSKAIGNVTKVLERYIAGDYDLEVIDIYQQPERLRGQQIIALPTLLKYRPLPQRRFVGNMPGTRELLEALELEPA